MDIPVKKKSNNVLIFFLQTCLISLKQLYKEGYAYRASALAYITLFSLVPLLSVIVSFVAVFPVFSNVVDLTRGYILTNFVPTTGVNIEHYLKMFVEQAIHLSPIGILFLILTIIVLLITIQNTLNEIWKLMKQRKNILGLIFYWSLICSLPFLIGLSIFIGGYIFSLSWFATTVNNLNLKLPLLSFVSFIMNTLIFSILYMITPNVYLGWRNGLLGGLIAAILFETIKTGFTYYSKFFSSYQLIYGAFATIPIFLLWLYLLWLIIIYGAIVTHTHYQRNLGE